MQDSDWTKCCPSYLVVVKDVCSPGITRVPGIYGNHPPRRRITIAAQHICIKLGGKEDEKGRRSGGGMGNISGEEGEKKSEWRICIHGEGGECVVSVVCEDKVHIEAHGRIVSRPSLNLLSLAVQKQQSGYNISSILVQQLQQQY